MFKERSRKIPTAQPMKSHALHSFVAILAAAIVLPVHGADMVAASEVHACATLTKQTVAGAQFQRTFSASSCCNLHHA
jgi:hypothetical protein